MKFFIRFLMTVKSNWKRPDIATNGFGLGEVAEPKSQIEKQNLIIKNE